MSIPSGEILLLRNVPLSETYEHSIDFKDKDEQYSYFYSFLKRTITKYTYIRREREFLSVEVPLKDLDDVNYMLFRSADGERLYYAFVTDKTYSNPSASYIYFTVDVLQTFQFDYKWNASYIKQSHVDRWNAEHKPIYSKTDEGLDYGTEYSVESAYRLEQSDKVRWLLVTMKNYSAILEAGYNATTSFTEGSPSTFINLLIPFSTVRYNPQETAVAEYFNIVNKDALTIVGDYNSITSYGGLIYSMLNEGLGDYIVSISLLTYNPFVINTSGHDITLNPAATYGISEFKFVSDITAKFLVIRTAPKEMLKGVLARADWDIGLIDSMPTSEQWAEIKKNPYTTERDKRYESKLLCSPYRYNLLSDWRNGPVIFKNEYLPTDKIEVNYSMALSHNAPARYWIKDYKRDPEGRNTALMQAIAPEFPIVSDAYAQYMLQNKNTIQANITNAMINAGAGVISGAISGAGVGGIGGGIFGAISGAAAGALNVAAQIRSENAKQADLKAVPDGVISNVDSAFNIVDGSDAVTFYRMRICCENEEILAQIFNMFGYTVNRVEIPNTRSRTRFNYLKTVGANITGPISQRYLTELKTIFNNGVTIWHYNKEHFNMLDYSYENIEVNLI